MTTGKAEMKIEQRAIEQLIPYARNARTHSDAQVAQIAASIREFGWTNPVLIDGDGGIIAGHGRVMAARQLGMEQVPVIVLDHLTDAQRRAYILADNKLALNAGWDEEMLKIEIAELDELDFDMELVGFSALEMSNIFDDGACDAPESSTREIDPDNYKMGCTCPKCGFEFDDK